MRNIKTITLGCKVNQYETEYLRQGFALLGYHNAATGEPVDLCIINTCTVTAESEAKSRKLIRRIAKRHPEAEIIVMGCYATRAAEEVAMLPGVVEVITDKRQLPDVLRRRGLSQPPAGIEAYFQNRRRACVKIQDGCDQFCAYCIIPAVRPHIYSRPIDEILQEISCLVSCGHHEIVLTGIHLGHYGRGMPDREGQLQEKSNLPALLKRISLLPGNFRVRLSSIEAIEVSTELLHIMAEHPERFCPHLHIPLQSGSRTVLKRMNRRYSPKEFVDKCHEIRAILDNPALTTDVIVGFPGETQADFEATQNLLKKIGFAKTHVFRFSPRENTPAAKMANKVTNRIVQQRAAEIEALNQTLQNTYCQTLLNRRLRVLVESSVIEKPGFMAGTCDRYTTVAFCGGRDLIGRFVEVTATQAVNSTIFGNL